MADHRKFIRHPSDIPIEFAAADGARGAQLGQAHDVSFGGLSFESEHCPSPGTIIQLRIPTVTPPFESRGIVVWCRCLSARYEVGVRFLESSDAFKARMVEQICHIEQYKRDVLAREGRTLTGAAAAREWIEKHASRFPGADAA